MSNGLVYIAYPIDRAQRAAPWAQDWLTWARDQLTSMLNDQQLVGYWPGRAFSVPQKRMTEGTKSWLESDLDPATLERIEHVNEHALAGADGMIVLWPAGMPSVGISAEISQALDAKQPVAFVSDDMTCTIDGLEVFHTGRLNSTRNLGQRQRLADAVDWLAGQIEGMATRGPGPSLTVVSDDHLDRKRAEYEARNGPINPQTRGTENTEPADTEPLISHDRAYWAERIAESRRLKIKLLHQDAKLPTRAYDDDAGLDLYCLERTVVPAGQTRDIPTGVAAEPPPGIWLRIVGRSSTLRRRDLLVNEGIIDPGWRGDLLVCVHNVGETAREVGAGERLAQLIPTVRPQIEVVQVDELSDHPRGVNGFGSTGT